MSVSGPLSHVDISVSDPGQSIPFYEALLTSIAYRRWAVDSDGWSGSAPSRATWSIRNPDGSSFAIEVRPACGDQRDRPYDRYEPGPHHMAFHASGEAAVDAAHAAVLAAGGTVLDPPTQYGGHPAYGEQYYAVFFADPDGLKLEVCYVRASNP